MEAMKPTTPPAPPPTPSAWRPVVWGRAAIVVVLGRLLVVDLSDTNGYDVLVEGLEKVGVEIGMEISVRLYSVYEAMHRIYQPRQRRDGTRAPGHGRDPRERGDGRP